MGSAETEQPTMSLLTTKIAEIAELNMEDEKKWHIENMQTPHIKAAVGRQLKPLALIFFKILFTYK